MDLKGNKGLARGLGGKARLAWGSRKTVGSWLSSVVLGLESEETDVLPHFSQLLTRSKWFPLVKARAIDLDPSPSSCGGSFTV